MKKLYRTVFSKPLQIYQDYYSTVRVLEKLTLNLNFDFD